MSTSKTIASGAIAILSIVPVLALAQVGGGTDINAGVTAQGAGVTASTSVRISAKMDQQRTRGDKEIDRRVSSLTELNTRLQGIALLSQQLKDYLNTNVQTQVTGLTQLKSKIDADTDEATLKADLQTITQAYRVFALLMPQARIASMADREATIITMLSAIGTKLQARVVTAQQAGADITAINTLLTDFGSKIGEAQAKAQAAVTVTATLTPDQGDKTKMDANTKALKEGRSDLQAAQTAIVAARADIKKIMDALKSVNASASTQTQTQVQTQTP